MTYLCCAPEDTARNLACLEKIYDEVQQRGVDESELVQAKSKICSYIVLQSERPLNRMFSVGSAWIATREYLTVRELLTRYERLTCRDVAEVLQRYPLTPNTTLSVGPRSGDA
jgi:predicted Zn-dependent peptidase